MVGAHPEIHRLRAGSVEVVVDARGDGLPRIVHWGDDLGKLTEGDLERIALASTPQVTSYVPDTPVPVAILPEQASGWTGLPGVVGHRDGGRDWAPLFTVIDVRRERSSGGTDRLLIAARDANAGLDLELVLELTTDGLLRVRPRVTNVSADTPYSLDSLTCVLPVPPVADEVLDLAGRHIRERSPQRQPFNVGTRLRESRHGHTGHDASLVLVAGRSGFGFREGEVWGVHVGWSGNHRVYAERLSTGAASVLGGGELLLSGEMRLGPGDSYTGPWLYGSYGRHGLDEMADRFHKWIRSRPHHPSPSKPRPTIVNTWEAVYFDHDLAALTALADQAAADGFERFVLDDGWFLARRDDTAGLGDWFVDPDVWPSGLHPLVDHVRGRGMEFGLWFEPESVNPNSRLAREHPDWIMSTGGRESLLARNQRVLDLSNGEAWQFVLERIDALLREYSVDFVKWDMNCDIVDGGSPAAHGAPAVHRQTVALYALLETLRARHPDVEIESCAGGGGRVDLGILEHTDRIWTSDTNDALERQHIQRWTGLLVPPELMGAHVGAAHSHTTGRRHGLAFRAGTALFGHFGVEMDVRTLSREENAQLAEWVELHRRFRPLLHGGAVVRGDHPDESLWVHGVVAHDRSEAVYALVGMATGLTQPIGAVRLPGLDSRKRYVVNLLAPGDEPTPTRVLPPWLHLAAGGGPGLELPGKVLATTGIQAPFMHPETLLLLHVNESA